VPCRAVVTRGFVDVPAATPHGAGVDQDRRVDGAGPVPAGKKKIYRVPWSSLEEFGTPTMAVAQAGASSSGPSTAETLRDVTVRLGEQAPGEGHDSRLARLARPARTLVTIASTFRVRDGLRKVAPVGAPGRQVV
jgi:hypothetical protein